MFPKDLGFRKSDIMLRISTIPTLYDEAKQIHLSELKAWKYLEPNQCKSGTITWSNSFRQTGKINITVNTKANTPYVELNYNYGDEPKNYRVSLVSIPSNLGKGKVWYFLCPHTQKRCRKLYSIDGYFLHREAFKGVMYEKQTYSANNRLLYRMFEQSCTKKSYDELHRKYFKKRYAGKPTKRYLKLLKKLRRADQFTRHDIQGMYHGIIPRGL